MANTPNPIPSSLKLISPETESDTFSPQLCIICQKDDKLHLTSGPTGRGKIKRAAEIREDTVSKRIKLLMNDSDSNKSDIFSYHSTNQCYKTYTLQKTLNAIQKDKQKHMVLEPEVDEASTSSGVTKTMRKNVAPCAPPSCNKDPETLPCIICGNVRHKGMREKYRICE